MVGRCIPYWNGHFLGDMLVLRGVKGGWRRIWSNFLANSFVEAMAKMRSSQDPNYLVSIGYPLPSSMGIATSQLSVFLWTNQDFLVKLSHWWVLFTAEVFLFACQREQHWDLIISRRRKNCCTSNDGRRRQVCPASNLGILWYAPGN